MLEAKCMAIRDMQLAEKSQIAAAMKEEGLRLDRMMEIDRVNDIQRVAQKEQKRKDGKHQTSRALESSNTPV